MLLVVILAIRHIKLVIKHIKQVITHTKLAITHIILIIKELFKQLFLKLHTQLFLLFSQHSHTQQLYHTLFKVLILI